MGNADGRRRCAIAFDRAAYPCSDADRNWGVSEMKAFAESRTWRGVALPHGPTKGLIGYFNAVRICSVANKRLPGIAQRVRIAQRF